MALEYKKILLAVMLPLATQFSYAEIIIPAGFEELAKSQRLWIDVNLYGDSLGVFEVDVNLNTVTFVSPKNLISAISRRFNDAPELINAIDNVLSRPLARNGNLACSSNGDAQGCDYVETDSAAVIYDENNARINLFLDKHFLPKLSQASQWYHTSVESENALIHQQNIYFVADRDYQSASLQGNGAMAVNDSGYFNLDWLWQGQRSRYYNNQDVMVQNAWFRQDFLHRYYFQLGEMDTRDLFSNAGGNITLSQLPIGKIRGARMGSTRAWLNTSQRSQGTPVTVFLTHDARVDARRGNQILASFYLNAGAQTLDTRNFPEGSYTVSLAIYENNILTRTETVPYTRTGIAPFDSIEWFMQGGETASDDNNRAPSSSVFQSGIRLPIASTMAVTGGATLAGSRRFVETAVDWNHGFSSGPVDGVLSTRFSLLRGSEGERGYIQQANYNDGFSMSFYRNVLKADDCESRDASTYNISGCYRSLSVMFSVPFNSWYANLGYSDNVNKGRYAYRRELPVDDERHNQGALSELIYMTRSRSQAWQAGLSRSFMVRGVNVNSNFNFFMRDDRDREGRDKGAYLSLSLSLAHSRQGTASSYTSIGATMQHEQQQKDRLSYNVSHNWYLDERGENEFGLNASGINSDSLNTSAYTRQGGRFGNGALTVSDAWDRNSRNHTLSTSGNYNSTLALSRHGLWFGRWGDGRPASAIAVNVSSLDEQADSRISVSVDNGGSTDVSANQGALFAVPGYQQTAMSVNESLNVSHGVSSEITQGSGTRKVFMPPGKMVRRGVNTAASYTWLGQLKDERNAPLTGALPLNVSDWSEFGNGGFSAQSHQLLKNVYLLRNKQFYQCALNVKVMRDVVRYVGEVPCQAMTFSALPEGVLQQAQLMLAGRTQKGGETAMSAREPLQKEY